MKIYNYHPQTFEYINESLADESPLEPGVFLIPACATTQPPLAAQDGKLVCFHNDQWVYQDIIVEPTVEELDIPQLTPEEQCKAQAKYLLTITDWSVLPDVNISNKAEFEAYRAAVRNYIVNPVADPVWPTEPQPVWSN